MRTGSYRTPFGSGCFLFTGEMIHRIYLPGTFNGEIPGEKADPFQEKTAAKLEGVFLGKTPGIQMTSLLLAGLSPFARAVLAQVFQIPCGSTCSYKEIADRVGHRGASRAVGMVMANNPFPLVVPCHRVIRSDGTIGGFQGSSGMKRYLLDMETKAKS